MSFAAVLFRYLLVAILILNGMGSAMAGPRMLAGAAAGKDTTTHAEPQAHHGGHGLASEEAPCHEQTPPEAGDTGGNADQDPDGSDCCHPGSCSCHCMQQAQAAVFASALVLPQAAQDSAVPAMTSAHESPPLPHLIRPPINQAS